MENKAWEVKGLKEQNSKFYNLQSLTDVSQPQFQSSFKQDVEHI